MAIMSFDSKEEASLFYKHPGEVLFSSSQPAAGYRILKFFKWFMCLFFCGM